MKSLFQVITLSAITVAIAEATVISDFQSDTVGDEPAGWYNANDWFVQL